MKTRKLLKHLAEHGCYPTGKQKGSHAHFKNINSGEQTIVPLHNEISDMLAQTICKQLGVPKVGHN